MKYIALLLVIVLASCSPCKYVSKHPECFPADTIKEIREVIRTEKEYIINDSIIRDSIPCDPADPITIETTIYKTKYKTILDSVFVYKDVTKVNPLNVQMQQDNADLKAKIGIRNKFILVLGIILLILLVVIKR